MDQKISLTHGTRRVARMDIQGGGQVFVHGDYVYLGHMSPPEGTTIIDVKDPKNPKIVAEIAPPDHFSHTHKVRVAGDLMITNVERHRRHFYRKGEMLQSAGESLEQKLGRKPSDSELAEAVGVKPEELADLKEGHAKGYNDGGFRVWDVKDKANPKLLSYVKTGGIGVHRFDMDENYAYISTEMEGYVGNILVIYDLKDPAKPREVSRWWMPGQHLAGGEKPSWKGQRHRLHHALRVGDKLWAGCWYAGGYVIDISDITTPKTLGSCNFHPPFPEPTHTLMPLPEEIGGRKIALMCDEEHDHTPGQPYAFLWIMDASDPANLKPISTFQVGELGTPFIHSGGRFGIHQFQEKQIGSLVFAAWFSGGLRIIDIADPEKPREIGHYIPEPFPGHVAPQSNDVDVDERGLIYLLDRDRGFEIIERV